MYWNTVNWKRANIKAMMITCILQELQSAPLYSFKLNSVELNNGFCLRRIITTKKHLKGQYRKTKYLNAFLLKAYYSSSYENIPHCTLMATGGTALQMSVHGRWEEKIYTIELKTTTGPFPSGCCLSAFLCLKLKLWSSQLCCVVGERMSTSKLWKQTATGRANG